MTPPHRPGTEADPSGVPSDSTSSGVPSPAAPDPASTVPATDPGTTSTGSGSGAVSDHELSVVPAAERSGWIRISTVWIAIGIDLSGALLGIQLAAGMPFWSAIAATMLGSLLLGLMAMACAYVGAASGLTTAMLSRAVFGSASGRFVALIMAVSSLGWFGVQTGFFADNARTAIDRLTGVSVPVVLLCVVGGALMTVTALWGYRSIERLSVWTTPLLAVLLLAGIGVALARHGTAELSAPVDPLYSFGGAVSLVMGIFVFGVILAPDIARWAKSPGQAVAAGFTGFLIGNSFIVVAAIILSRIMGGEDLMSIFFALGFGLVALTVLTLAQWTTNTNNLYSAAISLSPVLTRFSRRRLTLGGAVVATTVACLGIYDAFVPFISAMGIVIAPFGGVYLAEFFADRRSPRFSPGAAAARVNWWAISSWITGCVVVVLTTQPTDGLGVGLFDITSIPALDGLLIAFLIHFVLTRLRLHRAKRATGRTTGRTERTEHTEGAAS